jgi:hypothetical protein
MLLVVVRVQVCNALLDGVPMLTLWPPEYAGVVDSIEV